MAGHSKWKTIKRAKAATDAKRSAVFTKLIREITVAAKAGGGDPEHNPRLRLAIDTARSNSMPKENIERAMKKGTGELEGVDYQEIMYEGYGPGGVALLIMTLTDNPTRTVADVRHKFSRGGGSLGTSNSVACMFDRKGQMVLDAAKHDEDAAMEAALEAGAEDFQRQEDQYVVTTDPGSLHAVREELEAKGYRDERGAADLGPQEHGQGRARRRAAAREADRRAGGARRRAEGRGQLRHRRGRPGRSVTVRARPSALDAAPRAVGGIACWS